MTDAGVRRISELIELGRDREAAELGGAPSLTTGGTMDVLKQLDQLGPALGGVVAGIKSEQLDAPTPCATFTVRGVLEHMISGATAFAAAFRGEEPRPADTSDVLGGFGGALNDLAESIQAPGALDRTIAAPFGEVPGDTFARFVILDGLVHGWDLATATGQPYAPSDVLVDAVQEFAAGAIPPLRDGGSTFGDEVQPSAGATPIERLAAFTGRRPL